MTSDHKKPGVAFWATVVVIGVLIPTAIYVGAYAWVIEPVSVVAHLTSGEKHRFVVARYPRLGQSSIWRTFFGPANQLDRLVRPYVWQKD